MLSIKQRRSLYGFNKRKTEINGMLRGIDIEEILKWTDDEYDSVMVYMKKCKILRNTHNRLIENNTIINTTEPAIAPTSESTSEMDEIG
jgi:retron-type reverse transcriptase